MARRPGVSLGAVHRADSSHQDDAVGPLGRDHGIASSGPRSVLHGLRARHFASEPGRAPKGEHS